MLMLRRFAKGYIRLIETVGIAIIGAVAVLAVVQVFFRYVIGSSLFWSEELMRYLTVWGAFAVAGISYSRGEMMGFTLFLDALPFKARRAVHLLTSLAIIVFLLTVAWYGFEFAFRTRNDYAVALEVSMLWIHLAIPVGCILMALHVLASVLVLETTQPEHLILEAHL